MVGRQPSRREAATGDATDQTRAQISDLREKATAFRQLARQHGEADHPNIAEKLLSIAAEFEAKADALEDLSKPPGVGTP